MNKRLKEIRKDAGLTQKSMAARLGVGETAIQAFEAGRVPVPKARIYQVCAEFGVNRDWFEKGTGPKYAEPTKPAGAVEIEYLAGIIRRMTPAQRAQLLKAVERFRQLDASVEPDAKNGENA